MSFFLHPEISQIIIRVLVVLVFLFGLHILFDDFGCKNIFMVQIEEYHQIVIDIIGSKNIVIILFIIESIKSSYNSIKLTNHPTNLVLLLHHFLTTLYLFYHFQIHHHLPHQKKQVTIEFRQH